MTAKPAATEICPATKGRNNLRFNLDWAQLWECEREPRDVGGAILDVGEHRGFVGGWLRRKLFDSQGGRPLVVFSGHDYSICRYLRRWA